jgi:hypothetical protein
MNYQISIEVMVEAEDDSEAYRAARTPLTELEDSDEWQSVALNDVKAVS